MLRVMHKYRRSVFGLLFIGMIALMMSGFGVDAMRRNNESYAIKIDDKIISFDEFHRQKRELEQRYRSIFGKNYEAFSQQMKFNFAQMTVDKAINDYLLEREAKTKGLAIGDEEVGEVIRTQLFGGMFSPEAYANFLRQNGQTSKEFEEQVRADALRQAYIGLLRTVSLASEREARASLKTSETALQVDYLEFDPTKYSSQVKDPDSSVLEEFYNQHSASYELPSRISYDYVTMDPNQHLDLVEVTPEDIELYYSDNQSQFNSTEQAKVRHIQLTYSKEASPSVMADLKERAQKVHEKAVAGESFESLALQYSDDITTKTLGGDLGWISKGKMSPAFDNALFRAKDNGVLDLIETDYGFHIAIRDDYKPQSPKKLEEVRAEIENIIRKREAPAYTAERAHQLFDNWLKSKQTLSEFAAANNLVATSSNKLLAANIDPEPSLHGLTSKVIDFPDDKQQLADVGDKTILVAVKEYRDIETPSLAAVKTQVLEAYKKQEGKNLARQAAERLLKTTLESKDRSLKTIAASEKLEVKSNAQLTRASASTTPPFGDSALQKKIFASKIMEVPSAPLEAFGKYVIWQVTGQIEPKDDVIANKLAETQKQKSQELGQDLITSISNALKAKSVIDVAPGLVNQEA